MTRFKYNALKVMVFTVIAVLMILLAGAAALAEQLEDKNLTIAPLWYQPHVLASVEEAANTFNNFKSLVSDWTGGEIQQLSIDHSGVHFVAVITWTNENGASQTTSNPVVISTNGLMNIQLLHFPYLQRDNKWGAAVRYSNGSNITLRARTMDAAQKIIDSLVTLALANGSKLPTPVGLICQTANMAAEFTRLQWTGKGALVSAVFPGSPADQAGLKRDDIIVEVNGQAVADPVALADLVGKFLENRADSKLELKVFRDGQTITQSLTVKNLYYGASIISPNQKQVAPVNTAPQSLGISARNLTAEEVQKAGLTEQVGVYITSVDPGSTAEQMGMKPGDFLLEINGQKVANVGAVKQFLATGAVIQDLKIWRGGQIMMLSGVNKL